MKNKKILWIALALFCLYFTGCGQIINNIITKPVKYSFAGSNPENGTATITFIGNEKAGVRLVDCDGDLMPEAEQFTRWEPAIIFPAGKPINIRVYVYWDEDRYGERRRGIFKCPPLTNGRDYKLWFKGNYKDGGTLTLTYSTGFSSRSDLVYEQIIPPPPK